MGKQQPPLSGDHKANFKNNFQHVIILIQNNMSLKGVLKFIFEQWTKHESLSVAVSGNFVNETNKELFKTHIKINALKDPRSEDLIQEMIDLKLIWISILVLLFSDFTYNIHYRLDICVCVGITR